MVVAGGRGLLVVGGGGGLRVVGGGGGLCTGAEVVLLGGWTWSLNLVKGCWGLKLGAVVCSNAGSKSSSYSYS